jgi:Cu/Ag efflux protein CusF
MRVWRVVILLVLALLVGVGWGYLWWGRHVTRLTGELAEARAVVGGTREYRAEGVVRAVLPDIDVIVITHEEIPGYMPSMTMGFRATSPKIYERLDVGDAVRFTLRGTPPNLAVVAVEKLTAQ